jgi:DNA processing protein
MAPEGASLPSEEIAALVALLRIGARPAIVYAERLEETGSAQAILDEERGLLSSQLLDDAAAEIASWQGAGIRLVTVLDPDYPANLRVVYDRPPLLFVRGRLDPGDIRSVAVIGSRRASPTGRERARMITACLVDAGHTVVSGLASGVDTVAHVTALDQRGRTVAVIGTGLNGAYPPQNAALQERVAAEGAVVSTFWPETGPARRNFPLRNALMSGLALATVIVEAAPTSGARTQARAALAHGRSVLLAASLLEQPWARELAARPGVHIVRSLSELEAVIAGLSATDALMP